MRIYWQVSFVLCRVTLLGEVESWGRLTMALVISSQKMGRSFGSADNLGEQFGPRSGLTMRSVSKLVDILVVFLKDFFFKKLILRKISGWQKRIDNYPICTDLNPAYIKLYLLNTAYQYCARLNMSVQYTAIFHGCKNDDFLWKMWIFSYFCSKHRSWVHVRIALLRRF